MTFPTAFRRTTPVMLAFVLLASMMFPAFAISAEVAGTRPNIVFLLSDDMGYAEPGFNGGNPELTPQMDRLAREGMQLRQFYAQPVCAPTRASFLTGRYAFRTWSDWRSEDFGKPSYLAKLNLTLAKNERGEETRRIHALDTEERTIAEALRDAGYFTAITGKWHCGEWLPEHLPMGQGFLHQYGHYAWGIDYNNYTIPHNAPARYAVFDWHRNQEPLFEQGYSTDLMANEAVRLIAEQKSDRPFFIYVPFNAVHGPIEEVPRYTDQYPAREAALKCLDDAIGRVVAAVDQYGFRENTLVIFGNDNGGLTDEMNRPWRGTKNTTYEGGVRVPFVLRWPGKIEAGSINNEMMHITDLFPTFVTLAGAEPDQERPLDGIDMTETLFAGAKSPREEIIFEVTASVRLPTIRSGRYKLMGDMLYDIEADPGERTDIAAEHPEVVKRLKARLEEVGKERPPLGEKTLLMDPPLPWVYGQKENDNAPEWIKRHVEKVREMQPKFWPPGETPWPQAPEGATILYKGDGR